MVDFPLSVSFPGSTPFIPVPFKKKAKTHPKTSPGRGTKGATRRCSGRGDNNTPRKFVAEDGGRPSKRS